MSPFNPAAILVETHPASLLHGAVGVAVQAGENGARRHHFIGLVPAVSVAEARCIALTFPVEDGIQPGNNTVNNELICLELLHQMQHQRILTVNGNVKIMNDMSQQ